MCELYQPLPLTLAGFPSWSSANDGLFARLLNLNKVQSTLIIIGSDFGSTILMMNEKM